MTITDPLTPVATHILEFVRRVHCRAEHHQALQPTDPHTAFYYALEAEIQYLVHEYADSEPSIQRQLDAYYACQGTMHIPPPTGEHDLSELADYIEQLLATRRQSEATADPPAGLDDPELAAHLSAVLDDTRHVPIDPTLNDNLQELAASSLDTGASLVLLLRDIANATLCTDGAAVFDRPEPTMLVALWPTRAPGDYESIETITPEHRPYLPG